MFCNDFDFPSLNKDGHDLRGVVIQREIKNKKVVSIRVIITVCQKPSIPMPKRVNTISQFSESNSSPAIITKYWRQFEMANIQNNATKTMAKTFMIKVLS